MAADMNDRTTFALSDHVTVDVVRYRQLVPGGWPEPDLGWKAVDNNGHGHFAQQTSERYPTLRWVEDQPEYVDGDGEEYPAEGHWECRTCAEHIRPATRISPDQYVNGITEYLVTRETEHSKSTYRLSEDQWKHLMEAQRSVLDAALDTWTPVEVALLRD